MLPPKNQASDGRPENAEPDPVGGAFGVGLVPGVVSVVVLDADGTLAFADGVNSTGIVEAGLVADVTAVVVDMGVIGAAMCEGDDWANAAPASPAAATAAMPKTSQRRVAVTIRRMVRSFPAN